MSSLARSLTAVPLSSRPSRYHGVEYPKPRAPRLHVNFSPVPQDPMMARMADDFIENRIVDALLSIIRVACSCEFARPAGKAPGRGDWRWISRNCSVRACASVAEREG